MSPSHKQENKWLYDRLDAYLAEKQLKQTKQRAVVVDQFVKMDDHVDAEALHQELRSHGHNIGLATVYRTLNLLCDAGLAEQKSFIDGRQLFEVNAPHKHHDHLICLDCGHVVEFENEEIEELQKAVAKKYSFSLERHRLDLWGRCQKVECEHRHREG